MLSHSATLVRPVSRLVVVLSVSVGLMGGGLQSPVSLIEHLVSDSQGVHTATPTPSGPMLMYHPISTDQNGHILPWYSADPGESYDHVIHLVWNYWKNLPNLSNGIPASFQHRMAGQTAAIGGDQLAMALSSWHLLYQYSGDPSVKTQMQTIADFYLDYGLASSTCAWPNIPFPANSDGVPTVGPGFFHGDVMRGTGITQPDKAGSFASELVTLYQMTGSPRYLNSAIAVANTLASHTVVGDANTSPLPFRVNATTGQVTDPYTANMTGVLRLFDGLINMNQGNVQAYTTARSRISSWIKTYPLVNNKWGPFFEDIDYDSETEINADTMAWYILEHPEWNATWQSNARSILNYTASTFGNTDWHGINWPSYGVTLINEQTAYMVPGNSHTSRHGSVELIYSANTGDLTRKDAAIRQLNWATYMVDVDGKNQYPDNEIWYTDGYGDYIRHYLRAMAAMPELAPNNQTHLLKSTSVVSNISYTPTQVSYTTFAPSSTETLKLNFIPSQIVAGGLSLTENANLAQEGWTFNPTSNVLQVRHHLSNQITITTGNSPSHTPTPVSPTPTPTPTQPTPTPTSPTPTSSFLPPTSTPTPVSPTHTPISPTPTSLPPTLKASAMPTSIATERTATATATTTAQPAAPPLTEKLFLPLINKPETPLMPTRINDLEQRRTR